MQRVKIFSKLDCSSSYLIECFKFSREIEPISKLKETEKEMFYKKIRSKSRKWTYKCILCKEMYAIVSLFGSIPTFSTIDGMLAFISDLLEPLT